MLQSMLNEVSQQKVYTIITGASHGLGKAMAFESAKNGRNLIVVALPGSGLDETAKYIRKNNHTEVLTYELDLTNEQALYDFHNWVVTNNYGIDALINNAGTGGSIHFSEAPANYLNNIILLNIRALAILTRLFLSELRSRDQAAILNVSSMAAFSPIPFKSVYPASKAFVYSFSLGLREELRGTSVSVSVLHPGPMATSEDIKMRMEKHGWLAEKSLISAEHMARAAYKGMLSKRGVIIPGRLNRISIRIMALLPLSIKLSLLSRMTRFLNNKIVLSPLGGKSFVPVKDVAACVVSALEKGEMGRNYLISGENLTYTEFYRTMKEASGIKRTIIKLPAALIGLAGKVGTLAEKFSGPKRLNRENAALLNTCIFYPETMAFKELEIQRTGIVDAIRDAISWFRINGTRKDVNRKTPVTIGNLCVPSSSRLKLKTRISLFSFLLCLLLTPPVIQAQNLSYTVYAAGSDVGGLKAICTRVSGNSFNISLETRLNLPFKKIVSLIQARYDGNKLVFASSEKRINSKLDEWITISLQNGKYKIENEKGNKSTYAGPIGFSVGMLYHFEPAGQNLVFSERLGTFVPIKKTSTGVYELRQPDGKKNIFKYSNGVCTEMKTEMLASSVRFSLED